MCMVCAFIKDTRAKAVRFADAYLFVRGAIVYVKSHSLDSTEQAASLLAQLAASQGSG